MNDLLAQRKEIKRMEKEREKLAQEQRELEEQMAEEARQRELKEFEMMTMGLEERKRKRPDDERNDRNSTSNTPKNNGSKAEVGNGHDEVTKKRKRDFSMDEEEMHRVAREQRERIMREMENEKVRYPDEYIWSLQF